MSRRDTERGTVTHVVEWHRQDHTTVSSHPVRATAGPDGRLDAPVVLTVRVLEFNDKLQTFRDVAVGHQTFNYFITDPFRATIVVTPDVNVSIEVVMTRNNSNFTSTSIIPMGYMDQKFTPPTGPVRLALEEPRWTDGKPFRVEAPAVKPRSPYEGAPVVRTMKPKR